MTLARGTREWVKDPPLGRAWLLEYAMFCLSTCIQTAAAIEFGYRLGRAHAEFEAIRSDNKPKPSRSIIYG